MKTLAPITGYLLSLRIRDCTPVSACTRGTLTAVDKILFVNWLRVDGFRRCLYRQSFLQEGKLFRLLTQGKNHILSPTAPRNGRYNCLGTVDLFVLLTFASFIPFSEIRVVDWGRRNNFLRTENNVPKVPCRMNRLYGGGHR